MSTTRPLTDTIPDLDTSDSGTTDPGKLAHIVWPKEKVTEAYINGTPVEALCGFVFVPGSDPKQKPVCQACKNAYETGLLGKPDFENLT